ncbi:hypothetical protein TNCV_2193241 [Trichonephila clavipes]|nr:hypothetical protein TNCV_2193241 [Trichonephila clavipes]
MSGTLVVHCRLIIALVKELNLSNLMFKLCESRAMWNTPVQVTFIVQLACLLRSTAPYPISMSTSSTFEYEFMLLPRKLDCKGLLLIGSGFTKPSLQLHRKSVVRNLSKQKEFYAAPLSTLPDNACCTI